MAAQPKPAASLSSGLLARKGQARPAMRRQDTAGPDDLGWNDMGAPVVDALPPVLVERAVLVREVSGGATLSAAAAARIGRDSAAQVRKSGKVAFTLRLDGERHLRLRLASALAHQSAQSLVTQALDQFLATMPQVDALIAQMPAKEG
ncbi:hypothetical protein [uncultured Sphingomonas sp.]|uniref:hypothetical protein n=1 Tax=uncultured Sphingomonas sp. TaxID=158754 RepID=UPI00262D4F26|nr:hypothetical protein [uncultured Sphingomonas sp.]